MFLNFFQSLYQIADQILHTLNANTAEADTHNRRRHVRPAAPIFNECRREVVHDMTSPQSDEPVGDSAGLLHCRRHVGVAVRHGGRVLDKRLHPTQTHCQHDHTHALVEKERHKRAKDKVFKCALYFIIKAADITNYTSYNTVSGSSHLHHTYAILLAALQLKGDHSRELLHDSLGHLVVRVGGQARVVHAGNLQRHNGRVRTNTRSENTLYKTV